MSDDFLNMPMIFEPFQESSGFSDGISKTSEKSRSCVDGCLFFKLWAEWLIYQNHDTYILADSSPLRSLNGKLVSVTLTFVIKSVGANGLSFFLFLLFWASK